MISLHLDIEKQSENIHPFVGNSDCIICPKVVELNDLLEKVLKDDIERIDPYHCVACGKRNSWKSRKEGVGM